MKRASMVAMAITLDDRYLIWQLVDFKHAYRVGRFDETTCILESGRTRSPKLEDCLMNSAHKLFVSARLKDALERMSVPDVEYSPRKIIDRTGRVLSDPYYALTLLNSPDCLDLDASGATRSRILPGVAEKVKTLAFKNDPGKLLWHPQTFKKVILIFNLKAINHCKKNRTILSFYFTFKLFLLSRFNQIISVLIKIILTCF